MKIKYKDEVHECLLDAEDESFFSQWLWFYRKGYVGRVRRKTDLSGGHWVHLHREVLHKAGIMIPERMCVDHINRNKMDNRIENLRVVTRSQNSVNISSEALAKRKENVKKATMAAAMTERTQKQTDAVRKNANKCNSEGKNRHIGKDNYASRKVINTKTGMVYDSVKDASIKTGINYSTLRSWLNGGNPNHSDFIQAVPPKSGNRLFVP